MRKSVIVALVLSLLVAALLWLRAERSPVDQATQALTPPAQSQQSARGEAAASEARSGGSPPPSPSPGRSALPRSHPEPQMSPAIRERRRRVLDSLEARAAAQPASNAPTTSAPAPASAEPAEMRDRTGTMPETVRALNAQFGPLVDQCFGQARERGVNQRGMVGLAVQLASAEGVGRIIEAIEPAASNEIDDDELIDCLRQSAFTVDLPEEGNGRTDFEMTIPYGPARADAGAASGRAERQQTRRSSER